MWLNKNIFEMGPQIINSIIGGFQSMGVPLTHPVVMDYHDLVRLSIETHGDLGYPPFEKTSK